MSSLIVTPKVLFQRSLLVCFLLAFIASLARAELNLTPKREEFDLDGHKMWHLVFDTGFNQKASYQPPTGWLYSGSTNELTLQPPGKNQTQVSITKTLLKEPIGLDEESCKKLSKQALASLPEGSQEAKIESEELNPLHVSGNETYLVQISYVFYGAKFSRYCLFLNQKTYQMRFQLTSLESDYKELSGAFQASLYSWQRI